MWAGPDKITNHVVARDYKVMGGVRHAHYIKRREGYNELQNGGR